MVWETARNLARRNRLVDDNGTVWCWECNAREALLPSLHCPVCLAASWRRKGIVNPQCVNRSQTDDDRRIMRGSPPHELEAPIGSGEP